MNNHIRKRLTGTASAVGAALLLAIALPSMAQEIQPQFPVTLDKKLAARAVSVNQVTMDKKMLAFASQFLDEKKKDDRHAQRLIHDLNGIYVREYEFAKPGEYSAEDLNAVRRQFEGPEWDPMVKERSPKNGESTDVYIKTVNGEEQGIFVLDAEPKELDFVYISGPIKPGDLKNLSGNFGIPTVGGDPGKGNGAKGASK